jgi:hypothetical protein
MVIDSNPDGGAFPSAPVGAEQSLNVAIVEKDFT